MGAIGPLLALLGFFLSWSISEVLFTAEMGTSFGRE